MTNTKREISTDGTIRNWVDKLGRAREELQTLRYEIEDELGETHPIANALAACEASLEELEIECDELDDDNTPATITHSEGTSS
jgi:chromosome segregation ATPase